MHYSEALNYLYSQLPMFQRIGPAAYKNNLDNTHALDRMFNYPHHNFKSIHVAGTNGKGSVSHMLASVLQSAGYKVGLYTSPHLKDYRERIRVNGAMISEEAVCQFLDQFLLLNNEEKIEPSFFELSVAMAFDYFSATGVDVAVVEVGLGGRLDSTNIITPELSVITNISFDHTNLLGNTLVAIAGEKAGIIKPGVPVVIGEFQEEVSAVFIDRAIELGCEITFADRDYLSVQSPNGGLSVGNACAMVYRNIETDLRGDYQQKNLLTVVAAIEQLNKLHFKIEKKTVEHGLSKVIVNTGLQGRWQQIGTNPTIICDTGHNEAGIEWVVKQLEKQNFETLHIVFGTVSDKDISKILKILPAHARYYFTRANIDRAFDPNKLLVEAVVLGLHGMAFESVDEALDTAKKQAGINDLIFVGGSTFVVAEVL